jgi:hypothetical protein
MDVLTYSGLPRNVEGCDGPLSMTGRTVFQRGERLSLS